LPKVAKTLAITPKRRRMASILDAIMETTRSLTPTPMKKVAKAVTAHAETEAGPLVPAEAEPAATEKRAEQESPDASIALEKDVAKKAKSPAPEAPSEDLDYIIRHASGKRLSEEEIAEAKHYAQELKYPKGALVFNDTDEDDFLYCLPDNKEISVCREMTRIWDFRSSKLVLKIDYLVLYSRADSMLLQGLILSTALRAQKNAEDESCVIALGNLRSEVIKLRNEALEKDKILLSLVDKVKEDEAKFNTQSKTYKAEIEDLQKKLAKANGNFKVAKASQEISEWSKTRLEKNVEELREYKERCFEKYLDCIRKIKTSFARVGAYSSEENFIRGDPEGVIDWISREAEAFEEILIDRGDICAFIGARGVVIILEKAGCDHVKAATQTEAAFSTDDTRDPSVEATLVGENFYSDVWMNGGRELANRIIKRMKKKPMKPEKKLDKPKKLLSAQGV
jgi:hypothetical protein